MLLPFEFTVDKKEFPLGVAPAVYNVVGGVYVIFAENNETATYRLRRIIKQIKAMPKKLIE